MPYLKSLSANNPQKPLGVWGCAKFKKIIIILLICVFLVSFSCFSVSAVEPIYTGGATITILSGKYTIADGSSNVSASLSYDDKGGFLVQSDGSIKSGYEYACNCIFNFSADNNYGTLKLKVKFGGGRPYQSAYNRIYDAVNETNLGASVSYPTNAVSYTYTGYIPSSIRIAAYFVSSSDWAMNTYYDWSFTPIDKATNDIIANQNSNTDREIQADTENTQAIIDNQNQIAQQEKDEISNSGNDSVDGAMEVMPNYDLGDVFDGFINVMEYDGIDCEFSIPEIYIPSIVNITPKVVLYEGGTINFKDFFEMIPITILQVVRAFLTVALILFCFKELWEDIGAILSGDGIKIMREGTKDE